MLGKPPKKPLSLAGDSCRMRFLGTPRPPCKTAAIRQTAQSRRRSSLQRIRSDAAVTIRRARPEDMGAIRSSVQRERFGTDILEASVVRMNPLGLSFERFTIAAEATTGSVLGCGQLAPLGRTEHLELRSLIVEPDRRGAGIGHALLRSLVEQADAAGRDVYLTTLQRTARFYEAERFREVPAAAIPRSADCAAGLVLRRFWRPHCARALSAATSDPLADDRDHLPDTVYVPEGGRRVSTPDMPDVIRHSLSDPDPAPRHSMSDPRYSAGSAAKNFGGWDPRSFGNSLGTSMRDPPYDVGAPPPHLASRRVARRG